MRSIVFALALTSCYSPNPPSGAYLCSAKGDCPSSQSCVCGQCVRKAGDAACAFTVDATQGGMSPTVAEHASFPVTITALQMDKTTPATGFNGTVALSFRLRDGSQWCDVTPSTAMLQNGSATVSIALNRETIPPQTPLLTVTGPAGASGSTGKIVVVAPPFTKDSNAIVPPSGMGSAFGWADQIVAEPAVVKVAGGWRMFFTGYGSRTTGIGVATSSDGKSFTAMSSPIVMPTPGTGFSTTVISAAVLQSAPSWTVLFAGSDLPYDPTSSHDQIFEATSSDGVSFTVGNGGKPILRRGDCSYCDASLDFPAPLVQAGTDGGTPGQTLLFFAARSGTSLVSIARASLDGTTWTSEPAPVLQGDIGGEALLLAPTVLLDGSVYKMWYSFARATDFKAGNDLCNTPMGIGYATSSDGLYWVRSPSNKSPLGVTTGGWDAGVLALLAGSVVTQGADASSGFAIYYSTWRHNALGICAPNGIGRATRP